MLDIDTICRLNRIKKRCMPDRIIKPGPQVRLSIMAQLNDLLDNPRKKRVKIQTLKDKYHIKPRNKFLHDLGRYVFRGRYHNDRRIIPL